VALPVEVEARDRRRDRGRRPIGDLSTARGDLERLGRALGAAFRCITGR
jgi:hypothetical protein